MGISSKTKDINCGVPQGSCLGPLLFLIYINDLPLRLQNSEVTMFADDITISYSSKNISGLSTKLNYDLHCVKQRLHYNKLTLNVIKTQAMIIGSRPNLKKISNDASEAPCFVTGDTNINTVLNTKYLRVMLDQHLLWEEHVNFLQIIFLVLKDS